jgi:hypothetical protein
LRQPWSWTEFLSYASDGKGTTASQPGLVRLQRTGTNLVNVDRRQARDEQLELARVVDLEQGLRDDPEDAEGGSVAIPCSGRRKRRGAGRTR